MNRQRFVIVPFEQLSPAALTGLLEAYVSREGTDYGHMTPPSLPEKVDQVRRQLKDGSAVVVFDPADQSCTVMPRHKLPTDATF